MEELGGDSERFRVRGLCLSRVGSDLVVCDLLEDSQLEDQFKDFRPDVVIHTAAERRPDVVFKRPEIARNLNINVTESIATACHKHGAWMIFISTDYIFDGKNPPYAHDAEPHPLSTYGEQKAEGEQICKSRCPASAVLRVPLLYGPMEYPKESGVTAMYEELLKGIQKADHLQKRYPTYTRDVARILRRMLEVHFSGGQGLIGIYHWQTDECFTKYDMVQTIAAIIERDGSGIEASTAKPKFPVPPDAKLDCGRLVTELGIDAAHYRTDFKQAVADCLNTYLGRESPQTPESSQTPSSPQSSSSPIRGSQKTRRRSITVSEARKKLDELGASKRMEKRLITMTDHAGEIEIESFKHFLVHS
jgi:dTDP-4-dehydrorhamnose reductase